MESGHSLCQRAQVSSGWWLLLFVIFLGATGAVASYACSASIRRATGLGRRLSLVLGWGLWAVIATCAAWVLFQQADAEANRLGNNNIGIGISYFFGWVISTFVGPLLGYVSTALWQMFHAD